MGLCYIFDMIETQKNDEFLKTYKELKKRNIINQMTMDSVEINHNEADKPVLYCSNECRVYNQRANIQMEITNLIKEIKEGKTAVKNIEIFKDCPFFKK